MITSRYDSIAALLSKEGGYWDDPLAGPTNHGITLGTLVAWRGRPVTDDEMRLLPQSDAIKIYGAMYWDKNKLGAFDIGVAHFLMDSVVQHGRTPIKWAQKIAGCDPDGVVGAITIAAIRKIDPIQFIRKMAVRRGFYYESLGGYETMKNGWKDRLVLTTIESALSVGGANSGVQ